MAWVTGVMALTGGSVGSPALVCLLKQTTLPLQFFQGSHGAACKPQAEWTLVIFLPDNVYSMVDGACEHIIGNKTFGAVNLNSGTSFPYHFSLCLSAAH